MGTTAYFYPVKNKNKLTCLDFMQGTADLLVYQNFMASVHQAEYKKYQDWCENYNEMLQRYDEIFQDYNDRLRKIKEWLKDNPEVPNPEEGLSNEEQKRIAELDHKASYKRLDEISIGSPIELDKPHWLCNYLRKNDDGLLNLCKAALLSYSDIKLIVDKLKKCTDAKAAEQEFPAIGYYDNELYWKNKLSDGLHALKNVLSKIEEDDFVMYIEL